MRAPRRRGSVIVIVIWSVAIAAVLIAAAQILAFRQAAMGREAMARVEARWAARAGIEEMIAILEYHSETPAPDDARQLFKDLTLAATGDLGSGSWEVSHVEDGVRFLGPQDEHAKINLNTVTRLTLLELANMSPDVADAIVDWRDGDDNAGMMGAEYEFYEGRNLGYQPRNAAFRSVAELELVAGAFPRFVRGEDQNLNGQLDPNENDGALSDPPDDADGLLDAGWSAALSARLSGSKIAASGIEKLDLKTATPEEMTQRFGVTAEQAAALSQFAKGPNARLEQLLTQDLGALAPQNQGGRGGAAGGSGLGTQGTGGPGGGRRGGGRNGGGGDGGGPGGGTGGGTGASGGGASGGGRSNGAGNPNGRPTRITPSISSIQWELEPGADSPEFEMASMQSGSRASGSSQQSGRSSAGAGGASGSNSRVQKLDMLQLRRIFQEGIISQGNAKPTGRINLNTVSPAVLRALLPDDPISADAIVSARAASSTGLLAISDLLESNRISAQSLAAIAPYVDTQSYVFTITSRGRSGSTGLEVEITAVVDRSVLPARILEYREQ
jgi:type II secretory pathway component PulK